MPLSRTENHSAAAGSGLSFTGSDVPSALLDLHPDPVVALFGPTHDLFYVNAAALRLFGWSSIADRSLDDFALDDGRSLADAALADSGTPRWETQLTLGGKPFRVECLRIVRPSPIDAAAILMIWRAHTDVVPSRDAEEFVATVSHELRTPLTSIKGALGLVLSGTSGRITDKTRGLLDIAHRNAGRLVLLVNDILDLEKLTTGHMVFDLEPQDIGKALIAARDANASFAGDFGVTIRCDLPDRPALARVDAARLHQVLTNLISNACKFSHPHGTVTLTLDDTASDEMAIEVRDQGIGIPKDALETIFDRFNQAGSAHRNRSGSTGLGLAIVKSIVERHGGSIALHSIEGEGTCVRFTLPRTAAN